MCVLMCFQKFEMKLIIPTIFFLNHHIGTGIQTEGSLHSDSGSTGEHSGGLLEDDVGVPVWLYCDALSAGRRWPGL